MCRDSIDFLDRVIKSEEDDLIKELKKLGFISAEYTVEQIGLLEDKLHEVLSKYQDKALDLLSDENSVDILIDSIKIGGITKELKPLFSKFFKTFIGDLTNDYLQNVDKDLVFNQFCKGTTGWISSWSKELSKLIGVNTKENLENILNKGLEDGKSIDDIARDLQNSYQFSYQRARRIALTEVLSAHSYARYESTLQNPCVVGITWIHSGGKGINPRKNHMALSGTTVKKGKCFELSGSGGTYKCKFPRSTELPSSERVNCHCTFNEEVDNGILGLSSKEKQKLQEEAIAEADKVYKW